MENILVIKLSALGDFLIALPACAAIRKKHPGAKISLLTTKPFADLARKSGYFDEVILDTRPPFHDIAGWLSLMLKLRGGFDLVYDLQMNGRTKYYRQLFLRRSKWVGTWDKSYKKIHAFKRLNMILGEVGVTVGNPDLSWMAETSLEIKKPYALLIPGSSPQHPEKRWGDLRYAALGLKLLHDGITPVLIGAAAEADIIARIKKACPEAVDLSGHTTFYDIAALARGAVAAVGNDTGPSHLVAMSGCPTIVLFCLKKTDPERFAPVGAHAIAADDMTDISVEEVLNLLRHVGKNSIPQPARQNPDQPA